MEQKIKIAVLGGTGKAGTYLVQELLRQGFPLRLLLRSPENFQINTPLIELVAGDARNYEDVRALTKDCQAVISALGQPVGEVSIFSQATRNVLQAMQEQQICRYILLTGLNVDTPLDQKNPSVQAATEWMKTNYPNTTADKQVEYQLLAESTVDWTLVRLPWIHLTDSAEDVNVSLEDCPGDGVSAGALARFVVDQLSKGTYVRKAPFVANS
ncbi:NAD(P)-dependent oxidoreductase [Salmonirosea aquatica]|uniref:NAD(P)H-binding protein n=1 Tax=Salmonirosea aquatica TaxID=2654236 RepID=A0A7C9BBN4_9BACT|nr:NAD(P)H-binding protein [Cytophagaceae bacterium SJW1-29]